MKKLVLTSVLLLAACAFTFAGNERYPSKEPAVEQLPACAQFGGWDFGVNIGGALHHSTWNDNDAWVDNFSFDWAVGGLTNDRTGITTGGSFGYTWQRGCAIFGFQADGSWTSIDGSNTHSPVPDDNELEGTILHLHDSLDFWGSVRTRAGVVVDNLLLYVTGGLAFADLEHRWTVTDEFFDNLNSNNPRPSVVGGGQGEVVFVRESFSADSLRWGGIAGVGAEWALNSKWSFRTEYLYIYFTDEHTSGFSSEGSQNVDFDTQDSMMVSRFSLVYRFGGK